MSKKGGFTLIELLVVIAIIALLMSILMPTLAKVRKLSLAVACQARLKQWGSIFSLYTNDNDGMFHSRPGVGNIVAYLRMWPYVYKPIYQNPKMRFCPTAENKTRIGGSFGVWNLDVGSYDPCDPALWVPGENETLSGSYGFNKFCGNYLGAYANEPAFWRRTDFKVANKIPVFFDCQYVHIWSNPDVIPPEYEGDISAGEEIPLACLNRHMGHINILFMDWTVRKVGLKELWTLKWHQQYDTCGIWTVCGNNGNRNSCITRWNAAALWMRTFPVY